MAARHVDSCTMQTHPRKWARGRVSAVSVRNYHDSNANRDVALAVCVHDVTVGNNLYYRVGIVNKSSGRTAWGEPGESYQSGRRPDASLICMNQRFYIIETHSSYFGLSFFCGIGEVDIESKTIQWNRNGFTSPTPGQHPKVSAKDDGSVVIVTEQRFSRQGNIVLHSGKIDTEMEAVTFRINHSTLVIPNFYGVEPDVCMRDDKIIVACRSRGRSRGIIRFIMGCMEDINKLDTIRWKPTSQLSTDCNSPIYGRNPSISFNVSGAIVEVHQTWSLRKLSHCCGRIDCVGDEPIIWGESERHDFGEFPSISLCDDGFFYEVHKTNFGIHLYTAQGKFNVSHSIYLQDYYSAFCTC